MPNTFSKTADPARYVANIHGALDAFNRAGRPHQSLPHLQSVLQANYDKLNATGYFRQGDAQQLGHDLRTHGYVTDPTQGGAVDPNGSSTHINPYGNPLIPYPPSTPTPLHRAPLHPVTPPHAPPPRTAPAPVSRTRAVPPGVMHPLNLNPLNPTSTLTTVGPHAPLHAPPALQSAEHWIGTNIFGTGTHRGLIGNTIGAVTRGAGNAIAGAYDEATGQGLASQKHARAAHTAIADELYPTVQAMVGGTYGARPSTGGIDETVTQDSDDIDRFDPHAPQYGVTGDLVHALGTAAGDRRGQAWRETRQVGSNVVRFTREHPGQQGLNVASAIPVFGALARAGRFGEGVRVGQAALDAKVGVAGAALAGRLSAKAPKLARGVAAVSSAQRRVQGAVHNVLNTPVGRRGGIPGTVLGHASVRHSSLPPVAVPPTMADLGDLASSDLDIGSALRQTTPAPGLQPAASDAATHKLASLLIDPSQQEAMGLHPLDLDNIPASRARSPKSTGEPGNTPLTGGNNPESFYREARGALPSYIVINRDAVKRFYRYLEPQSSPHKTAGFALTKYHIQKLEKAGPNVISPETLGHLQHGLKDNKGHGVIVINAHPRHTFATLRETLLHEPQHLLQFKYPLLPSVQMRLIKSFKTDPELQGAWTDFSQGIGKAGYPQNDWVSLQELPAWIASGGYRKLLKEGKPIMSEDVAERLYTQYADTVRQQHGGVAAAQFYNASPPLRRALLKKAGALPGSKLIGFTGRNNPIFLPPSRRPLSLMPSLRAVFRRPPR